jgi:hypothetical protein
VTIRKPTPWTNAEIKRLKIAKRKAEKKWKRTKLNSDLELYKTARNRFNMLLDDLKAKDLSNKISQNKNSSKALFKIINSSLNRKQMSPLPDHDDEAKLADEFIEFFDSKINNLKNQLLLGLGGQTTTPTETVHFSGPKFSVFRRVTNEEVRKLIKIMPSKHCSLDPLPTWLMKECIDEFLPITTEIINLSLELGTMPSNMKHALIKPLLKKTGLELIKKHYQPVSNLAVLYKLIEGAVITQIMEHLTINNLHDTKQSAYKKNHSTETLLTKVHNDIMLSMSKGEVVMLVLLDLSAAFDTVDHKILLNRLQNRFGIDGTVLQWLNSYLFERTQAVVINDTKSKQVNLTCGVPQGSKLGPVLFNAYITPLSEIADKHGVDDEKYADDEQLILSFKPSSGFNQQNAINKMEKCIEEIREFLLKNKLCNNSDKTEFLLLGNINQLTKANFNSIRVGTNTITTLDSAKNLGVLFDKHMTMEKQVNKMVKSAYFNIRNIARIRKNISNEDAKTVVNALITPHLDYGNALLYGIHKKLEKKLQLAQNSAARLICRASKREHITPIRKDLHWLPIHARIKYKILTLVWKALNDQSPLYLKNLIKLRQSGRTLRTNERLMLEIPDSYSHTKDVERCFSRSAPRLWNTLPVDLKKAENYDRFKSNLKTYLFKLAYE